MNKRGDLISREALIRKIRAFAAGVIFRGVGIVITAKDSCNPYEWTKGYEQGVKDAAKLIGEAPAVDAVEVVHGRWEEYQEPHIICCSVCDWGTGVEEKHFKYCPNCGARMDGE